MAEIERLAVPIEAELIGQMFLRRGVKADVSGWVEDIVRDYLDRTADEDYWDEAYYQHRASQVSLNGFSEEFGDPKEGYYWSPLFLPNGTKIRMDYRRQSHFAAVKFGSIVYEEQSYSPSELASRIANGTSRNAWRDLFIMRPEDSDWMLADLARRRLARK